MDAFMLKSGEARNAICKSGTSVMYGNSGSSGDTTGYFDVPEDISSFTRMKVCIHDGWDMYNWTPNSSWYPDKIELIGTDGNTSKFKVEVNSSFVTNGTNVFWTLYKFL